MYSRARLDALADGIFGVAMTLLVLDIRLPEDFRAANSAELISGLAALTAKFVPYVLSFFVLGVRWMYEAEERRHGKEDRLYSRSYAQGWLLLLFLVTYTPSSDCARPLRPVFPQRSALSQRHSQSLGVVSSTPASLERRRGGRRGEMARADAGAHRASDVLCRRRRDQLFPTAMGDVGAVLERLDAPGRAPGARHTGRFMTQRRGGGAFSTRLARVTFMSQRGGDALMRNCAELHPRFDVASADAQSCVATVEKFP